MSYKQLTADCVYCNCCNHMVYNTDGYYDHGEIGFYCIDCEKETCPRYQCGCILQDYCQCN